MLTNSQDESHYTNERKTSSRMCCLLRGWLQSVVWLRVWRFTYSVRAPFAGFTPRLSFWAARLRSDAIGSGARATIHFAGELTNRHSLGGFAIDNFKRHGLRQSASCGRLTTKLDCQEDFNDEPRPRLFTPRLPFDCSSAFHRPAPLIIPRINISHQSHPPLFRAR